ncbi:BREX system P-loop protein BrxC [Desulfobacterium sp. N47]|uniref:BREX system P-loop protein BrxC n=1 Tax=Desulfobacterium sp. N47 TaxID=3115210 RepID=UPI003C821E9E
MMEKIKELFDPKKDIHRTIEKVITYNASQENRLKAEITEYVVTDSIEEQFEKLLSRMQAAMEAGGENEVGVWVSGFYGSGKSSFTKYLGLALDDQVQIGGTSFIKYLQDRLHKAQTKALLSTVSKRFPAAVVFLDLASEMLAGANMEDVSTVLFYKVLQFAGYSRNIKIAAFERKLQKDGRYEEFEQKIKDDLGTDWSSIQNDPLVVDSMIPDIAHQMYPEIFKTPFAFNTETSDFIQFENERVKEMIDIVRDVTGKQYILFIIDEVGQYIGSRQNLILNMDGLAKNLKQIGNGKAWIISTAQQTLTEDDPRAAFNSPELYKLKDRFPIQVDLESSDIKEICYRRLLGKSSEGEKLLDNLFVKNGEALRYNTKLQDAKYYDSDFNKETFINLYPFLPAHFDILLHLLGALAKSTGGIGLRSAIKVVQDILIEGLTNQAPVAEQTIGWLTTTVIIYDTLEKDIRKAFPSIHQSVGKVVIRFNDSTIHQDVAKTVGILQILGNLPVTVKNVSSLMHSSITSPSRKDEVQTAVDELINDPFVPFGEQEGNLCFYSEKLNDIEQERANIPLRNIETRRLFNEALKEAFNPLPTTRLNGTLVVRTGLKFQSGSFAAGLAGERETIQTVAELSAPGNFDTDHTRLIDESRARSSQYIIYLLGKEDPEINDKLAEIYRCREICNRYRNDPDQEVKEYCSSQSDRATKLTNELQQVIKRSLTKGSFLFRGKSTAIDNLDQDLLESCKKHLASVAPQVFDRNSEAPVRVDTTLAEKFLRAGNLSAITSQIDPLDLVQTIGATPSIYKDHISLISIRDYIDRNGTVEGKRLIEHFTNAPFGWSQDTLRYLIAALLLAGEIKLKVSGREVTVNGQQAIDALKTNNTFRPVGVSLRVGRPSNDILARAAKRLTELIGDTVVPLEDEISKTAAKHLPQFQNRYAPLGEKLNALNLPGADRIQSVSKEIADVLFTDASDAPERLGGEESGLYENLKWAGIVDVAFKQGLENTIRELQRHIRTIRYLPDSGVPGLLRQDLAEEISLLEEQLSTENFYQHPTEFSTSLTNIKAYVRDATEKMNKVQEKSIKEAEADLRRLNEWHELTQEEQSSVLLQIENFKIVPEKNIDGIKQLITQEFNIYTTIQDIRKRIISMGTERAAKKEKERLEKAKEENTYLKTFSIPVKIISLQQLNDMLKKIEQIRVDAIKHDKFEIRFIFDQSPD